MLKQILRKVNPVPQPTLEDVLQKIEQADDAEISQIIQAVVRRYKVVYPDWEVLFLSLPLQPEDRAPLLEQTIDHLKKL